ncbi:MAG: UDP-N-acetylmuramoylalanyl-D-glutamyl-2,6-diaminopimelate--D-alanyl-D-alanine ligase [Myxococcaceae bacterium]|nr:UDP-N-acetylmuramoylalanyl-D-glutamyl-2,6-diaminopimelate--D-alanyl-D-alanine ligase [Myxococcaceae bacterium]
MATPIPKNDARFSLAEIAAATAGRLVGGAADAEVSSVTIDSRAVSAGSLFVAIRGESQDGVKYIPAAISAGAGALLVADADAYPDSIARIEVADTTRALGDLAAYHRKRWGGRVVAITGSAGKTTTKELTAAALEGVGARVLKTSGNLNNQFGVPMMLLCASEAHDTAVLELGTSGPGEIARLGAIVRPDVSAVLLAALAHTEGLVSLAAVADEKASLWAALGEGGTAIINTDDVELMLRAPRHVKLLSFGTAAGATVRLLGAALKVTGTHTRIELNFDGQTVGELEFELRMLGQAAAIDACAAIAVVLALFPEADRMSLVEAAVHAMAKVEPTRGRMCCIATRAGVTVCDDSYNANPRSMGLGLETLRALANGTGGRGIAVIADMKDLGSFAHSEHVRIGELAVRLGVDLLVGCGAEMAHATSAAARLSAGRLAPHPTRVAHVMAPADSVALVQGLCRAGDVVFVKGSRAMEMEKVAAALVEKFGGAA